MANSFVIRPGSLSCSTSQRRKVFVTGASGNIGAYFAKYARDRHELTLMVRSEKKMKDLDSFGRCIVADLGNLEGLKSHLRGQDTVVHLAARAAPDTLWEEVLPDNIVGTYNLFVAAKAAGCRRVIFASSIHAVSGYPPGRQIHPDDPVNPGDLYGVSKCFGEAMARYMAEQHHLSSIVIRIGAFQPVRVARQEESLPMMEVYVSRRDLSQLLLRCIDDEALQFAIFHGLSNNRFNVMDISTARELVGYEPEDDFTALHPELRELDLRKEVEPHDEGAGQESGIRKDLRQDSR